MITTNDILLIDRFINEELSKDEVSAFQQRVRDDYEFSHEVRTHIAAVKSIRSFSALHFMDDIKTAYPSWKSGGYQKYSKSLDTTKILLWILVPAIILGLSYTIYRIVRVDKTDTPTKEQAPTQTDSSQNSGTINADTTPYSSH